MSRWSVDDNFHENWNERTEILASFVTPGERVLEFGAGMLALPNYLPDACEYTATDVVSRGPGSLICNLNDRVLPELPRSDVAVFRGVLEYVNDLPRALSQVIEVAPAVVCSYATTDMNPENRRSTGG